MNLKDSMGPEFRCGESSIRDRRTISDGLEAVVLGSCCTSGVGIFIIGFDFYDGEGSSGVGGYAVFDIDAREYKTHYLEDAADWSCSALLVDGDQIWMGLRVRPEGAPIGRGLLRYDRVTGESMHYEIQEIIHAITKWKGRIYFGTANGIGILEGERLVRATFDVDSDGRYYLRFKE